MNNKQDKQSIWIERLKQAREYPGSVGEFCASGGFTYANLKYWRNKLEGKGAIARRKAAKISSPFVRVQQIEGRLATAVLPVAKSNGSPGARFVAEVLWHMSVMGADNP